MTKKTTTTRRGSLRLFILTFVAMAGLALVGTGVWRHLAGVEAMGQQLDALKPYLTIWRWSLILALIAAWPPLVRRFLAHWPEDARERMVGARWRLAIWLVLIELVIVQGVVGKALGGLLNLVTGSGEGL